MTRDYRRDNETIHVLRSMDLMLRTGELVGILRPSGSGKSTLLTIIDDLRTSSNGTAMISSQPFSGLPEKQWAGLRLRRIGFMLQASGLVSFLKLNDQLSLHDQAARAWGDTDQQDHLPDSLGVTRRAHAYPSELSGGERQYAAIVMALYHGPDIILADEPTASLDTRQTQDVIHPLADQAHELGKATVMVAHNERLLPAYSRVLAMHSGVLAEQDVPKDSEGQSGSCDDR